MAQGQMEQSELKAGKTPAQAREQLQKMFANVPVRTPEA